MRSKLSEIYHNALKNNFNIIILTETWLNNKVFDAEILDERYRVFRRDRESLTFSEGKEGGGVIIAVHKSLNSFRNYSYESHCEDLWITIDINAKRKIHLCALYLPPPVQLEHFEHFSNKISTFINELDSVMIVGDFNMSGISWSMNCTDTHSVPNNYNNQLGYALMDFMSTYNLLQYNTIYNDNNKILDLVLANFSDPISVIRSDEILSKVDKYHPQLLIQIGISSLKLLSSTVSSRYKYFKADYQKIEAYLVNVDWEIEFTKCETVDQQLHKFYEILYKVIKEFVPIQQNYKRKYPIWYSFSLIKILKEKEKLRIKAKVFNNDLDRYEYELLKERTKKKMNTDYSAYIENVQFNICKNFKNFWLYVKNKYRNNGSIPQKMKLESRTAEDGVSIANLFADNFAAVYNPSSSLNLENLAQSQNNNHHCLGFIHLSEKSIETSLKKLNVNKGAGEDDIHPVFFKRCATTLCKPLYIIYNKSLQDGDFPRIWKKAKVIPIPKSGDKSNVKNYRPISILCVLGKVFESLLCPILTWHVKQMITEHQHGFFRNRSTTTNLAVFMENTIEAISSGKEIDVIYCDFKKAFDKVDHNILIKKLHEHFGIFGSLLQWFQSYLNGRTMTVNVNGHKSYEFTPTSGVPQGSHLGPILFLTFVDDIKHCILSSNFEFYADDLKLYKSVDSEISRQELQDDIGRLCTWCKDNLMELNREKCFHMKFSRKKVIFNTTYDINGFKLNQVTEIEDLGIIMDKELRFISQINTVISKSLRMLGFIHRNTKKFKSILALKILYFCLVRSNIDYCSLIWYPDYQNNIQRIENIQKKFLKRLVYTSRHNFIDTKYEEKLEHFNMKTLRQRCDFLRLIFVFKLVNNYIDCPSLLSLVNIQTPRPAARAINYKPLYIPQRKNRYGCNSPLLRSFKLYNFIFQHCDIDIFSDSLNLFKKKLYLNI